jgi:hypothetical protein
MRLTPLIAAFCLPALILHASPPDTAQALLARSLTAFQRNQNQEKHWNWTATENRTLVDKSGQVLQSFPAVTAESVIRSDGRRCNAVVAWGDGKPPYLLNSDPDARCQAMDEFRPAFQIDALLESGQAKLLSRTDAGIALAILPDKARLKSGDPAIRCAASIRATVQLDPKTFFPRHIDGEVVETGCDRRFEGVVQYDSIRRTGPLQSNFRKGAIFRMEFAFQKDRFQTPANSYWICVEQHYSQPWNASAATVYYWGRQVRVAPGGKGHRFEKAIRTTAQEFGVDSQPHYETVGRLP